VKNRYFFAQARTAVVFALLVSLSTIGFAKEAKLAPVTPHAVVENVTKDMMAVIKGGDQALKDNPEKYFGDIRATLESTVSFKYIAQIVMANYYAKATAKQRDEFAETFTRSMVETLGKGMANYTDLVIKTVPPAGDVSALKKVEVLQEVEAASGTIRISYTMAKNRSNEWKLINVILNGVNLGKSYRDQFVQSMKQNDNNIDKVIATWSK
jgi:phospholipid transport system substrate-binding protein